MDASESLVKFKEFLNTHKSGVSVNNVNGDISRVIVNINEVRQFSKELCNAILNEPMTYLPVFEEEIGNEEYSGNVSGNVRIGFEGAVGSNQFTSRALRSSSLSKMVCVEGIVTSVSLVRPKIKKSVHYSSVKNVFYEKEYRDATMVTRLPCTNTVYPTRDDENNLLEAEFGLSEYSDFQILSLQEMPENAPPSSLPRGAEVAIQDDLVDFAQPGDRIKVYGIYKSIHNGGTSQFPTRFKTVIIASNIVKIGNNTLNLNGGNSLSYKLLSPELLVNSIAPTIFGHLNIKKALALLFVGGVEKIMNNGSKIRGDINILLVGDPSTAKSQMLRFALGFAPLSVATTGRGSSGVGLTAAVVRDPDTGDKRLEAGAMVLADRGLVCIDEFDKMDDSDRVAIHEVMEQQTVSISKAGIHTTLNARCSVLAAANPIMGSFNHKQSVQDNLGLPESLMTRFDLVFITHDNINIENDRRISQHVLKNHSNFNNNNNLGNLKNNLGNENIENNEKNGSENNQLSLQFLKNYFEYCKTFKPVLSKQASSLIIKHYVEIRKQKNNKSLVVNITPRFIESLIRLSTANAKLRLSNVVEEIDVIEILSLIESNSTETNIPKIVNTGRFENKRVDKQVISKQVISKTMNSVTKDEIFDKITVWRENNQDEFFLDLKIFTDQNNIIFDEAENIIKELAANDLLVYDEGKIYFID